MLAYFAALWVETFVFAFKRWSSENRVCSVIFVGLVLYAAPVLGSVVLLFYIWHISAFAKSVMDMPPFLDIVHVDPDIVSHLCREHERGLIVLSNHHNWHESQVLLTLCPKLLVVARDDYTTLMGIPSKLYDYCGHRKNVIKYIRNDKISGSASKPDSPS